MTPVESIKRLYIRLTGYSYTHMGRLFLRLFIGVMLIQLAINQLGDATAVQSIMSSHIREAPSMLRAFAIVELVCSFFIMAGFLTRLMTVPVFLIMCYCEWLLFQLPTCTTGMLSAWNIPAFLPVMFLGVFFFILLVGPGKISCDYFLSLHFIHSGNRSESELEEV